MSGIRIGVDLGGTKIEAIALAANGTTLVRRRVPTPRDDYDATIDAIVTIVDGLDQEIGARGTVGLGTPGAVSPATGRIKNSNSTWLLDRPLAEDLAGTPGASGAARQRRQLLRAIGGD